MRYAAVVALIALAAIACTVGPRAIRCAPQAETIPAARDAPPAALVPSPAEVSADERWRRLAVGTWQDHYQGLRSMTLRADGTGEMRVELQGVSALLFADKLRFQLDWHIADGVLCEHTQGGEPAAKVQMLLKTFGDHVTQKILALDGEQLQLLDADGKTHYQWKRLQEHPGKEASHTP